MDSLLRWCLAFTLAHLLERGVVFDALKRELFAVARGSTDGRSA